MRRCDSRRLETGPHSRAFSLSATYVALNEESSSIYSPYGGAKKWNLLSFYTTTKKYKMHKTTIKYHDEEYKIYAPDLPDQGRRRERTLDYQDVCEFAIAHPDEVMSEGPRRVDNLYHFYCTHGGSVANSYGYPAKSTCAVVIIDMRAKNRCDFCRGEAGK